MKMEDPITSALVRAKALSVMLLAAVCNAEGYEILSAEEGRIALCYTAVKIHDELETVEALLDKEEARL